MRLSSLCFASLSQSKSVSCDAMSSNKSFDCNVCYLIRKKIFFFRRKEKKGEKKERETRIKTQIPHSLCRISPFHSPLFRRTCGLANTLCQSLNHPQFSQDYFVTVFYGYLRKEGEKREKRNLSFKATLLRLMSIVQSANFDPP